MRAPNLSFAPFRSRLPILASISIFSLSLYILYFYPLSHASTSQRARTFRANYPYTRSVIIPSLSGGDYDWLSTELPDLIAPVGPLNITHYSMDNENAPLHTPANKGHEAMAYLTYLIDRYDDLPDVSIFIHGNADEWHNNHLLNNSTPLMLRLLNLDKVVRDGYVNLRCEWKPGCPDQIHPYTDSFDAAKLEEMLFREVWPALFDGEEAPQLLAQPCCSQFAVSRETVRRVPREKFEHLRKWLLETWMADHDSGRIFEYAWQVLFAGSPVFCPDPMLCYCEAYGVCFERKEEYEEFFALKRGTDCRDQEIDELENWYSRQKLGEKIGINLMHDNDMFPLGEDGQPEEGLKEKLESDRARKRARMAVLKAEALQYGSDPRLRASAIEARLRTNETVLDGFQCNREHDAGFEDS